MKNNNLTLIPLGRSSFKEYVWFHPDDAEQKIVIDGKNMLTYTLKDGSMLGFEHIGGEVYDFNNYEVYKIENNQQSHGEVKEDTYAESKG